MMNRLARSLLLIRLQGPCPMPILHYRTVAGLAHWRFCRLVSIRQGFLVGAWTGLSPKRGAGSLGSFCATGVRRCVCVCNPWNHRDPFGLF